MRRARFLEQRALSRLTGRTITIVLLPASWQGYLFKCFKTSSVISVSA